jgi:Family of unknown function (DUF6161)
LISLSGYDPPNISGSKLMVQAGGYDADLGPLSGSVRWDSLRAAITWLGDLAREWTWSGQDEARYISQNQVWVLIENPIGAIRRGIEQAIEGAGEASLSVDRRNTVFAAAVEQLRQLFEAQPWLRAGSPEQALIADVRSRKGDVVAAAVVAVWLGVDLRRSDYVYAVAQATVELELFLRGAPKRIDWETKAYEGLIKTLEGDRASHLAAISAGVRQVQGQEDDFNAAEAQRSKVFDDLHAARSQHWGDVVSAAKADLENIKDAYDKHMALAAPVEYWQSKQTRHFKWMCATGGLTAIAMLVVGWLLHHELAEVSAKAAASAVAGSAKQEGVVGLLSALTTWRLGSFILLATLAFWVLRLLVRVFLSNMHLENDAAERVTMVKTYLAFTRHGQLTGDSDNLTAILAALFRPTGDGIVKDDGAPPGLYELLTKLK